MAEELHLDHSTISVRLKHYKKRFPELFDEAGREKFMELRKKERAAKREERQKNLKQRMRSPSMVHLVYFISVFYTELYSKDSDCKYVMV